MQQQPTVVTTPRPSAFSSQGNEDALRIDVVGRAVDDVVGAFVQVLAAEGHPDHADVRVLAAAARRLWKLAARLNRPRGKPF